MGAGSLRPFLSKIKIDGLLVIFSIVTLSPFAHDALKVALGLLSAFFSDIRDTIILNLKIDNSVTPHVEK
jgi:hypothetical protein